MCPSQVLPRIPHYYKLMKNPVISKEKQWGPHDGTGEWKVGKRHMLYTVSQRPYGIGKNGSM